MAAADQDKSAAQSMAKSCFCLGLDCNVGHFITNPLMLPVWYPLTNNHNHLYFYPNLLNKRNTIQLLHRKRLRYKSVTSHKLIIYER